MRSRSVPMSGIAANPTTSLSPVAYMKDRVAFEGDAIALYDEEGIEIVRWVKDEWVEDPDVVLSIVNAVRLFYQDGPRAVKRVIGLCDDVDEVK